MASFFLVLPFVLAACALSWRVALAFWPLFYLSPARGRESGAERRGEAVLFSARIQLSPPRGRESCLARDGRREPRGRSLWGFLFRPMFSLAHLMPFLVHLMLSRVRPVPLCVEQVVVQRPNLVFGRSKPPQKK